jgi:hypothetical protein
MAIMLQVVTMLRVVTMNGLALTFLLLGAIASGETVCSLRVQVTNPDGGVLTGIPVSVHESDGRIESTDTQNGEATFCGLGRYVASITVGLSCGEVTVRNVPLAWGITRTVRVIYDRTPCLEDRPAPRLLCGILLRFREHGGGTIPGVELSFAERPDWKLQGDEWGRAMIRMAKGDIVQFSASAAGFDSERGELVCTMATAASERIVVLRRR